MPKGMGYPGTKKKHGSGKGKSIKKHGAMAGSKTTKYVGAM